MTDWRNKLFFGDNLDILRNEIADESIDLIYLDHRMHYHSGRHPDDLRRAGTICV